MKLEEYNYYSKRQDDILAALELKGETGASRDEIMDMLGISPEGRNRQGVGRTMGALERAGKVEIKYGRYRLPAPASINGARPATTRPKRQVVVYATPETMRDVESIGLHLTSGQIIKIPMWRDLKICYGPDIPNWSPEQESYEHVKRILIFANGQTIDRPVNPQWILTIAPND